MRQSTDGAPIGWDEVVVGHDFGFLKPEEIQAWVQDQGFASEGCERLVHLEGPELETFEAALRRASSEITGKTPRPGGTRWARAQDRWRFALLKDAMEAPLSAEALGVAVETIYECVGCPEDMLDLWSRGDRWTQTPATAHRPAIEAFLRRTEEGLVAAGAIGASLEGTEYPGTTKATSK
jgi:hypothetical protein